MNTGWGQREEREKGVLRETGVATKPPMRGRCHVYRDQAARTRVADDGKVRPGTGRFARSSSAGLVLAGVLHVAFCPHIPFLTPASQHGNTPVCRDVPFMDPLAATGLNNTDKPPGAKLRARNAVRSFVNTMALRPPNAAGMASPRSADRGLKGSEDRGPLFVSACMPERAS